MHVFIPVNARRQELCLKCRLLHRLAFEGGGGVRGLVTPYTVICIRISVQPSHYPQKMREDRANPYCRDDRRVTGTTVKYYSLRARVVSESEATRKGMK